MTPSDRRVAVRRLQERPGLSERRGCLVVGVPRGTVRRRPKRAAADAALTERIRELAYAHPRYGCPRVTALLRRGGCGVNHKRVHRIWKAEGLSLRRRRPKRRRYGPRGERVNKATHRDHVWTYDFLEDRTETGGKLRMLSILDEYTRECLLLRVGRSTPASRVIEALSWLLLTRGVPEHIRSDNGPEFIAYAVQDWLAKHRVKTLYIEPGHPWENGHIESFHDKLRDECLNRHIFRGVADAQEVAEAWRVEYNTLRPHSSLGYETPEEFAARAVSSGRATPSLRLQRPDQEKTLSLQLVP